MNLTGSVTLRRYKMLLRTAGKEVCEASMREAAEECVLENDGNKDVTAIFNGSWQWRGHQSLNGIVSAIAANTGKVVDCRILMKDLMKKCKRPCLVKDHRSATAPGTGKAATSKKLYVYYEQLQFILPYVKGNPNKGSNIGPSVPTTSAATNVDADDDDMTTTPNNVPTNNENDNAITKKQSNKRKLENPNVVAGKRAASERAIANSAQELTNFLAASLQMQREDRSSDKYGHRAFLMSFLPVLDGIPFKQSMVLRGKFSQVFTNYFVNRNVPSTSQSPMFSAPQTPASETFTDQSEVTDEFNISD